MAGVGTIWNSGSSHESNPVHACGWPSMCAHQWEDVSIVLQYTRSEAEMRDFTMVVQCVYKIVREVNENLQGGVQLTSTIVQILLFANNIVMVTEKEDMQSNLDELK